MIIISDQFINSVELSSLLKITDFFPGSESLGFRFSLISINSNLLNLLNKDSIFLLEMLLGLTKKPILIFFDFFSFLITFLFILSKIFIHSGENLGDPNSKYLPDFINDFLKS